MQRGRPVRKSKSRGGLIMRTSSPLRGNAEQVRLVSASLVKQRRRRESVRQGAESTAPRYRPGFLNYATQRPAFGCSGVPHIRSTDWPSATSRASPHARASRARPRIVPVRRSGQAVRRDARGVIVPDQSSTITPTHGRTHTTPTCPLIAAWQTSAPRPGRPGESHGDSGTRRGTLSGGHR